jgi:hypothetical protein
MWRMVEKEENAACQLNNWMGIRVTLVTAYSPLSVFPILIVVPLP